MTHTAEEITNNHHHHHPQYFTTLREPALEAKRLSSFGFLGGWLRLARFTVAAVSCDALLQTKAISPVCSRGGERQGKL